MEDNIKYEPIHTTADWDMNFEEAYKTININSPTINVPNINMGEINNNEDK